METFVFGYFCAFGRKSLQTFVVTKVGNESFAAEICANQRPAPTPTHHKRVIRATDETVESECLNLESEFNCGGHSCLCVELYKCRAHVLHLMSNVNVDEGAPSFD